MGYITTFTIEKVEGSQEEYNNILNELKELGLEQLAESETDTLKWYDHAVDLEEITSKHPEAVVLLLGRGEDIDDVWYEYWKAGKFYRKVFMPESYEKYNTDMTYLSVLVWVTVYDLILPSICLLRPLKNFTVPILAILIFQLS